MFIRHVCYGDRLLGFFEVCGRRECAGKCVSKLCGSDCYFCYVETVCVSVCEYM